VKTELVYGLHAVQSLLKTEADRVLELQALKGRTDQRLSKVLEQAKRDGIAVTFKTRKELDSAIEGNHQGIIARCTPGELKDEKFLANLLDGLEEAPFLLLLDGVTDPHNIGAIMRSACAFGAEGIIVQDKNTPPLNATAIKIACGAAEHIPFIRETNLSRAIEQLQKAGYWCVGLDERGENSVENAVKGQKKITLVLGAEGSGLRKLVAQNCDELAKLPTVPPIYSLNVSNAAAVSLYEFLK